MSFTSVWEAPPAALAAPGAASSGSRLAPMAPAVDICTDYGIDTVSMQVLSGAAVVAEGSFPCGAHSGTINDVPAGSGLVVRLQGSIGGSVLWRGNSDNAVTVNPGQTTNAGTIAVAYIGADNVAPTIVSVSPDNNTTNVPNAAAVRLRFSERMAINTVLDNASIVVTDNAAGAVPGTVGYDGTDNSAVFTPASPFASGGSFTLTVSPAVTDMAGHPLPGPYVTNFTAHTAGTFVGAVRIENFDGYNATPTGIVTDAAGNLLVVGELRGTPELLWSNRFAAATKQWGVSARIPPESFMPLSMGASKLVSDNTGNALLLFEYSLNNINYTLAVKQYDPDAGWIRSNQGLSSSPKLGSFDIAADAYGNAIAVWVDNQAGNILYARQYISGFGWAGLTQLAVPEDVTGSITEPKVAMNATGDAIVAWGEYSGGTGLSTVRARRFMAATGWEAGASILDNQALPRAVSVVVDGNGSGMVLWNRLTLEAVSSRYTYGQGWEGPVVIGGGGNLVPPMAPTRLGVDDNGRILALWVEVTSIPSQVRLMGSSYDPGSGWGSAVVVAVNIAYLQADFSLNSAGRGFVAWVDTTTRNVLARRYEATSDSWGDPMTVDIGGTGYTFLRTVIDPAGTPCIVWGKASGAPPRTMASWVE